jgi:hypothetical protein
MLDGSELASPRRLECVVGHAVLSVVTGRTKSGWRSTESTIHDNRFGSLGHAACNRHDRPDGIILSKIRRRRTGHCFNKSSIHAIALIAPAVRANEQRHGLAVRADANLVASKRAKGRRGLCSLCSQRFSRWAGLMVALLVCSQGI